MSNKEVGKVSCHVRNSSDRIQSLQDTMKKQLENIKSKNDVDRSHESEKEKGQIKIRSKITNKVITIKQVNIINQMVNEEERKKNDVEAMPAIV